LLEYISIGDIQCQEYRSAEKQRKRVGLHKEIFDVSVKKRWKTIAKIVSQSAEKTGIIPCNFTGYCLKFLTTIYCCSEDINLCFFSIFCVLRLAYSQSTLYVTMKIGEKVT